MELPALDLSAAVSGGGTGAAWSDGFLFSCVTLMTRRQPGGRRRPWVCPSHVTAFISDDGAIPGRVSRPYVGGGDGAFLQTIEKMKAWELKRLFESGRSVSVVFQKTTL